MSWKSRILLILWAVICLACTQLYYDAFTPLKIAVFVAGGFALFTLYLWAQSSAGQLRLPAGNIFTCLGGACAWFLLSAAWAQEPWLALLHATGLASLWAWGFALQQDEQPEGSLPEILCGVARYGGMVAFVALVLVFVTDRAFAIGTLGNADISGAFCAALLPLVGYAIVRQRHGGWLLAGILDTADKPDTDGTPPADAWKLDVTVLGGGLVLLWLLAAGSRIAWLASIAALLASSTLVGIRSRGHTVAGWTRLHKRLQKASLIAIVGFLVLAAGLAALHGTERAGRGLRLSGPESTMQSGLWTAGMRLFAGAPFTGVGAGHYGVHASKVRVMEEHLLRGIDSSIETPQNDYIRALAEGGLVGFVLLVATLVLALRRLWCLSLAENEDTACLAIPLFSMLLACCVVAMGSDAMHGAPLLFLMAVALAGAAGLGRTQANESFVRGGWVSVLPIAGLVLTILVAGQAYQALRGERQLKRAATLMVADNLRSNLMEIETLSRAAEQAQPYSIQPQMNLGTTYQMAGEYKKALTISQEVLTRRPWCVAAHVLQVKSLAHLGKLEDATTALEKAERLMPGNPRLVRERPMLLTRAGRYRAALGENLELQRQLLLVDGTFSDRILLSLDEAELLRRDGADLMAENRLRYAAGLTKNDKVFYGLSSFYLKQAEKAAAQGADTATLSDILAKAESSLRKTLDANPGHRNARFDLIAVLGSLGRLNRHLAPFDEALKLLAGYLSVYSGDADAKAMRDALQKERDELEKVLPKQTAPTQQAPVIPQEMLEDFFRRAKASKEANGQASATPETK